MWMEDPVEVRIPKQFRHWCEVQGMYSWGRNEYERVLFQSSKPKFMVGNEDPKRYFRALPHRGWFQMADDCFDRWANSIAVTMPIPMCHADFDETIETMLEWWSIRVTNRFLPSNPDWGLHEVLLDHPFVIEVPYGRYHLRESGLEYVIDDDLIDLATRLPGRHRIYDTNFLFDDHGAAAMMKLALT
jgi:hypothetical protein